MQGGYQGWLVRARVYALMAQMTVNGTPVETQDELVDRIARGGDTTITRQWLHSAMSTLREPGLGKVIAVAEALSLPGQRVSVDYIIGRSGTPYLDARYEDALPSLALVPLVRRLEGLDETARDKVAAALMALLDALADDPVSVDDLQHAAIEAAARRLSPANLAKLKAYLVRLAATEAAADPRVSAG